MSQLAALREQVQELERALGEQRGQAGPDDATFARTLFSNLPDYVYFKDRERRFLRFSQSFEQLLGRPAVEIVGQRDEELFPANIAEQTAMDDRRVIEQGIALVNKLEGGEVAPGVERWVLTTKLPWRAPDGQILGLFGMSRDFTAQKKLEDSVRESERRLRIISDTVPFPVAATRVDDGTLLYANRALAEFIDMPLEALLGSRMPDHYADPAERDALIARVREEGRVDGVEIRLRRHDGAIRIAASSVIPLVIDGVQALMGAGADVTVLKAREAELRELGAQKDLLLREVNHRVRNNLATLGVLIRQQLDTAQGAAYEALERIDRSVRGLSSVHAMLSDSEWRPVEIAVLCRNVVRATLRDVEPPPPVRIFDTTKLRADSQQAHQLALVMGELATNSLKHARTNPTVEIEVSIERSTDGTRVIYRDDGPGFPDAVLHGDGRGFGLRLIEGLVRYGLNGRISLSNNGGAVTTLDLPAVDADHGQAHVGAGSVGR